LHYAALEGNLAALRTELEAGADVNTADLRGYTRRTSLPRRARLRPPVRCSTPVPRLILLTPSARPPLGWL